MLKYGVFEINLAWKWRKAEKTLRSFFFTLSHAYG